MDALVSVCPHFPFLYPFALFAALPVSNTRSRSSSMARLKLIRLRRAAQTELMQMRL
jgi:hypothetical protein